MSKTDKILLGKLPFWDPLIPPVGIASIKSYLNSKGFNVSTFAANINNDFLNYYDEYFKIIKSILPENRYDSLFHLGHFVLQDHLMAIQNDINEKDLTELVKLLVYHNFYVDIQQQKIIELNNVLVAFYLDLEKFLVDLLKKHDPQYFGLTVYKGNLPTSVFAFKVIKKYNSKIKTLMGGGVFADHLAVGSPNFEYFEEKTVNIIDHIFIGQGESLLYNFLTQKDKKSEHVIMHKDNSGIYDFSMLTQPDYSDFNVSKKPYFCIGVTGSISCLFQCSFCNEAIFFGKYRKKDVAHLVQEIDSLSKKYSFQLFFMTDSLVNPIVKEFSNELIKNRLPIYYDAYFRISKEATNIENTTLWRQGGFYRARIGVESGSQKILDIINKRISVEQSKQSLKCLADAGIKTTTYWIVGHPGETRKDFDLSIDMLYRLSDSIWQAECAPFDYYYRGQNQSETWASKSKLLYPEKFKKHLWIQTWILDDPDRKLTYNRVFEFSEHCKKAGIPNPYSLNEIQAADDRWHDLHVNAVPKFIDLRSNNVPFEEKANVTIKKNAISFIVNKDMPDF